MVKHLYAIKPCPWCKKTPRFYMFLGHRNSPIETWLPEIQCRSDDCKVQPKSKYVAIRKNQKINSIIIKEKIEKAIANWNDNNPMIAIEGIELDFDKISSDT
jgi:hypothetical protein